MKQSKKVADRYVVENNKTTIPTREEDAAKASRDSEARWKQFGFVVQTCTTLYPHS